MIDPNQETKESDSIPTTAPVISLHKGLVRHKHCTKCNKRKPLTDFPANKDSSDGKGAYCRQCKSELSKNRRVQDAGARFTHYIVSRLQHEFGKEHLPSDLETNLEGYLGYKLWELRRKLRLELKPQGITLTKTFIDGWHLDHKRPLSSFPKHKVGDNVFQQCWAIANLEMIPALQNLQKGAKYAEETDQKVLKTVETQTVSANYAKSDPNDG